MNLAQTVLFVCAYLSVSASTEEDAIVSMIKRIVRETVADEIRIIEEALQKFHHINAVETRESKQYETMIRAFVVEKQLTRKLNQTLIAIENRMDYFGGNQQNIVQKVHEIDFRLDTISSNQENVIKKANELIFQLEELKQNFDGLQNHVDETKCSGEFKGPSFISDWILMKSQDNRLSEISLDHGLGVLPSKVEVLVKPTEGPNKGWIFHGDSAFRNDDDFSPTYGGVVYLYDERKVVLFAPNRRRVTGWRAGIGSIIYTGSEGEKRLGNNHQASESAMVRVKVWGPKEMPIPDFESSWLKLNVRDHTLSYFDIPHGLDGYPALVIVQIMHEDTGLISEGVSSSVVERDWLNGGGTVWGFDNTTVRIWSAYLPNQNTDEGTFTYHKPIGSNDGWGRALRVKLEGDTAKFRVLAWSQNHVVPLRNFFTGKANKRTFQFGPISDWQKPTDKDVLSFYIEAKSGPNKGYRFRGYGGSHAKDEGFGGCVFAYSDVGLIRAWPPNPEKRGQLIHIISSYGNGKNTQASDDAEYVYSMIKTKEK